MVLGGRGHVKWDWTDGRARLTASPARCTAFRPYETVFRFTKSRTETFPRSTRVSVHVQRSSTSHLVPRTVAELYWPLVRNLPLPSPHSRRFFFFLAAALALPLALQPVSFSTSVSVVIGPSSAG